MNLTIFWTTLYRLEIRKISLLPASFYQTLDPIRRKLSGLLFASFFVTSDAKECTKGIFFPPCFLFFDVAWCGDLEWAEGQRKLSVSIPANKTQSGEETTVENGPASFSRHAILQTRRETVFLVERFFYIADTYVSCRFGFLVFCITLENKNIYSSSWSDLFSPLTISYTNQKYCEKAETTFLSTDSKLPRWIIDLKRPQVIETSAFPRIAYALKTAKTQVKMHSVQYLNFK